MGVLLIIESFSNNQACGFVRTVRPRERTPLPGDAPADRSMNTGPIRAPLEGCRLQCSCCRAAAAVLALLCGHTNCYLYQISSASERKLPKKKTYETNKRSKAEKKWCRSVAHNTAEPATSRGQNNSPPRTRCHHSGRSVFSVRRSPSRLRLRVGYDTAAAPSCLVCACASLLVLPLMRASTYEQFFHDFDSRFNSGKMSRMEPIMLFRDNFVSPLPRRLSPSSEKTCVR